MGLISRLKKKGRNERFEYLEGSNAFSNGLALNENPYEADSESSLYWQLGWENSFASRHNFLNNIPTEHELFIYKVKRLWGMFFRVIFISSIMFISYCWLDAGPIGDIPFSQLTLNLILKNLALISIILGCMHWLFKLPIMHRGPKGKGEDDPYLIWADFSGGLLLLGFFVYLFFNKFK